MVVRSTAIKTTIDIQNAGNYIFENTGGLELGASRL
jgi:hypothetical protein